jgi:hypothetical protein
MAVNFTTNIALAKPTESELALNWARVQELQEDNNIIIADAADFPLVSYTPVLTATTTPPNLGTGSIRGEYQDFMGFVTGSFAIEFLDAGITVGSGEYGVRLPFVVDNTFHIVATTLNATPGQYSVVGEGYTYDDSNVAVSGSLALDVATVGGFSYIRMLTEAHTTPAKGARIVGANVPTPVANLDKFIGQFFYKRV